MKRAWQDASRYDQATNGTLLVDPLQGVRPEFQFGLENDATTTTTTTTTTTSTTNINTRHENDTVPLLIVHGVEITARDMDREAELLARLLPPGTYVQSVEYAPGAVTYFTPLEGQFQALCQRLRTHQIYASVATLDVLGHSSGAVLARAVAQNVATCLGGRNHVRVRHYVGMAGPQQGVVAGIPGRPGQIMAKSNLWGPLLVALSRTWFAQAMLVSTASYLYNPRNPNDNVTTNFGPSSFVGRLNMGYLLSPHDSLCNTSPSYPSSSNSLVGEQGILGSVLLVASMRDQVIQPTESAFFSRAVGLTDFHNVFAKNTTSKDPHVLRPVCHTDLWQRDTIGLRQLWDEKRVFVYRSNTHHGPLPFDDYIRVIAPFLRNEFVNAPTEQTYSDKASRSRQVQIERICDDQVEMQVLV